MQHPYSHPITPCHSSRLPINSHARNASFNRHRLSLSPASLRRDWRGDLHCAVMDGHAYFPESHEDISSLLGRLPSAYSPCEQMTLGAASAGHLGAERRRSLTDQELDSLDCDLEDAAEVSDEPAKVPPTRSSSSKRNRAAEVHNLSEKRRRSRINEKMKALQSLIPNSSKTDKASMLDEAIEYLKQLQLQVQMLSMRNSLDQHPMYLHGALQPLQAMQLASDIGLDAERAMSTGLGMLPLNQGYFDQRRHTTSAIRG